MRPEGVRPRGGRRRQREGLEGSMKAYFPGLTYWQERREWTGLLGRGGGCGVERADRE